MLSQHHEQKNTLCTLIISCQLYKDKWPQLMETMHNHKNDDYYIVYGDPNLPVTAHLFGRFIILQCNDYYEGLPEKVSALYKFISTNITINSQGYTHFLKIDDTNKIHPKFNFKQLEATIDSDYEGALFFGPKEIQNREYQFRRYHFGRCTDPNINITPYKGEIIRYCGGGAYILSKRSVHLFQTITTKDLEGEYYEDLFVGKVLLKSFIIPQINSYARFYTDKEEDLLYPAY